MRFHWIPPSTILPSPRPIKIDCNCKPNGGRFAPFFLVVLFLLLHKYLFLQDLSSSSFHPRAQIDLSLLNSYLNSTPRVSSAMARYLPISIWPKFRPDQKLSGGTFREHGHLVGVCIPVSIYVHFRARFLAPHPHIRVGFL